jgi:hypothetical protein
MAGVTMSVTDRSDDERAGEYDDRDPVRRGNRTGERDDQERSE